MHPVRADMLPQHSNKSQLLKYVDHRHGHRSNEHLGAKNALTISYIIQFFRNPIAIVEHVARLQHPAILEVIIHADSNTTADAAALAVAVHGFRPNVRVVYSDNVHEIRGYNKVALQALGNLLCFGQDDRLPPNTTSWVETALTIFSTLPPSFAALGYFRGGLPHWGAKGEQHLEMYGSCGGHFAKHGGFLSMPVAANEKPIYFVSLMAIGPIWVRASAFDGFNESYSKSGEFGAEFASEFTTKLWLRGMQAAVTCASIDAGSGFINGWASVCGPRRYEAFQTARDAVEDARAEHTRGVTHIHTRMLLWHQFREHEQRIMGQIHAWQDWLRVGGAASATLATLRTVIPSCIQIRDQPIDRAHRNLHHCVGPHVIPKC